MKNNLPKPDPIPPTKSRTYFWAEHNRRPAFLFFLVIGLIVFISRLPGAARTSLWYALSVQQGLIFLLSLFALLTLSLIWSIGQRLDMRIFMIFNLWGYPKWLDIFMRLTTQLGNMLVAVAVAILLFLFNYRRLSMEIIFGTITLWILVEIIKSLTDRDRPFLVLEKTRVIGWREKGNSFPSGHTSQIFFMMTLLIHGFHLGIVASGSFYAVASVVGFTRIYVGAHYPRDVIAGVVLGLVWGILAILVDRYWLFLYF
jgi:membrane-associated phospholipid phosphatase